MEQAHYANKRRSDHVQYQVNDLVYVSTTNIRLPKGRTRKLLPKFIGPYKALAVDNSKSTVILDLPAELQTRRIHPTFHTSLIRPHIPNDDIRFPNREAARHYDLGHGGDDEWFVDEIIGH